MTILMRPAEIVETPSRANGFFYKVTDGEGGIHNLRGLGAPSPGKVGEKGWISYTKHSMGAWWFWSKTKPTLP